MKKMNNLINIITLILIPVVTLGGATAFMLGVGQLVSDMPHTIELAIAAAAMAAGIVIKSSD